MQKVSGHVHFGQITDTALVSLAIDVHHNTSRHVCRHVCQIVSVARTRPLSQCARIAHAPFPFGDDLSIVSYDGDCFLICNNQKEHVTSSLSPSRCVYSPLHVITIDSYSPSPFLCSIFTTTLSPFPNNTCTRVGNERTYTLVMGTYFWYIYYFDSRLG